MPIKVQHISNYADILAIPGFALSVYYFAMIPDPNLIEMILLVFSITGFVLDILFTIIFLRRNRFRYF